MSEVPPSPPPYRKVEKVDKPATFVDGLKSRMERFQALARKATQDGNDRKARCAFDVSVFFLHSIITDPIG